MNEKMTTILFACVGWILVVQTPFSSALSPHWLLSNKRALSVPSFCATGNRESSDSESDLLQVKHEEQVQKLSRPERKALQRQRNARKLPQPRRYELHSTAVPYLTLTSTAADVLRAIKRAQNRHDTHDLQSVHDFLIKETDDRFAYGYKGSLLARLAVAALHMHHHTIARNAIDMRKRQFQSTMLPMESAAILRGLLRVHNVTDALYVLDDELSLPNDLVQHRDRVLHRAQSLASIASRYFFEKEPALAVLACQELAELGPIVRNSTLSADELQMPWPRILRGAATCEACRRNHTVSMSDSVPMPCNLVYSVLNCMTTFPSSNNDKTYEILSNALVRRVVFVTGAVEMSGCPPADRGEAVFIGRSNVGKSSLVNMVTNRKALAFISKRPGKTQQFNFFAVNDKPDLERQIRYGDIVPGDKDPDSFYIVDLPGFGYAKVPPQQREQWLKFMHQFISERRTLRVVFHLVDSRHGPTAEDGVIMRQIGQDLKSYAKYVIVLTKADKNVKSSSSQKAGKVAETVMTSLRESMKQNGVGNAPVILTSAETKLGRDDIWRYLKAAAEK
jgi:GTP-binding protein